MYSWSSRPAFASCLLRGETAPVQAILDGSDTIGARANAVYLDARTRAFGASLSAPDRAPVPSLLVMRSQAWYNPTLKSLYSMVPGLVAVALQLPSIALALALSRERESGSFEGLVSTPVRGSEYLLGKLTAYLSSGIVSALLVLAVAALWFGVPFRASVWQFIVLTCVFFLASMGLAMLPGNLASSQQSAMVIMLMIVVVPSFFLSGLLLPVDHSSRLAQMSASILPATHFIRICRSLFLKGGPIGDLWPPAAALAVAGTVLISLNLLLFRKRA
jgi:ABC-2 type transport system permease protein